MNNKSWFYQTHPLIQKSSAEEPPREKIVWLDNNDPIENPQKQMLLERLTQYHANAARPFEMLSSHMYGNHVYDLGNPEQTKETNYQHYAEALTAHIKHKTTIDEKMDDQEVQEALDKPIGQFAMTQWLPPNVPAHMMGKKVATHVLGKDHPDIRKVGRAARDAGIGYMYDLEEQGETFSPEKHLAPLHQTMLNACAEGAPHVFTGKPVVYSEPPKPGSLGALKQKAPDISNPKTLQNSFANDVPLHKIYNQLSKASIESTDPNQSWAKRQNEIWTSSDPNRSLLLGKLRNSVNRLHNQYQLRPGAFGELAVDNPRAFTGYAEATRHANETGLTVQAHGMNKDGDYGSATGRLISLFTNGLDPNRPGLYTDAVAAPRASAGAGAGSGSADGEAYRDGGFQLLVRPGKTLQIGPDNPTGLAHVSHVVVDQDAHESDPSFLGNLQSYIGETGHQVKVIPQSQVGKAVKELHAEHSSRNEVSLARSLHEDIPLHDLYNQLSKAYKTPAWQRAEGQNPKGGLNAKGRASAKAEGHNLKAPVKSGDNPRRASFLARMGGSPGPEYDEHGKPTRLLLALQAWGASSKADAKKKAKAISARLHGSTAKSMQSANPLDVVHLEVPLLIRLLEYAREDAASDIDLHEIAEKMIHMSQRGKALDMNSYRHIINDFSQ